MPQRIQVVQCGEERVPRIDFRVAIFQLMGVACPTRSPAVKPSGLAQAAMRALEVHASSFATAPALPVTQQGQIVVLPVGLFIDQAVADHGCT